ncbi:serine/threonine-protein kinase pim-1-like isoform X1 [Trachinotus anak]|uniref:serine/threonine-protein kinase pim-1-like isoform X1 n=1 Tax=Trachinotus anak TaxID=443729 RepID=UPI0039F23D67
MASTYTRGLNPVQSPASARHLGVSQDEARTKRSKRKKGSCDREKPGARSVSSQSSAEGQRSDKTAPSLSQDISHSLRDPSSKRGRCSLHSDVTPSGNSITDFDAKYEELELLGEGGFGSVYAGFRILDELPVAIKHIPQELVKRKLLMINGDVHDVPVEVVLILKATGGPESAGSSAAMYLLDWYDLDQELILVLERPVPCVDLRQYLKEKGGSLQEHEAKIMMQQLVEAAIELHSKQVFHRDIKLENIIVETGPDVPRARVADFSCGCFARKGHYHLFSGTPKCAPPEWYMHARYKARPTTVWQLGVVLYGMLDGHPSFDTLRFLRNKLPINSELSQNCQELLQMCLSKVPKQRPTLEQLQHHPWLQ